MCNIRFLNHNLLGKILLLCQMFQLSFFDHLFSCRDEEGLNNILKRDLLYYFYKCIQDNQSIIGIAF